MSDYNRDFDTETFKPNGEWNHEGSKLAGEWQAKTGQGSSQQQSNELAISYETRQNAYDSTKSEMGKSYEGGNHHGE